mmetsp:Transcript_4027/g.11478  ORF Transcript_4027/g.11478 Transcript_4027/m.11478 type:complete len:350 (-) Transcript_4027:60-1109(-)|eukprot:CAMPEP_0181056928 /NCGR_PEP_ID=MMETSP1070-20121207/19976_1 /TAXON_ID=265543 /ORGANISM="Minutocellus polymorphus, Strain NH13" /LENGTH=349 /DNA_ID=CAMNT_0023136303 /DNA_START=550 /DNA_END=1599 /DNA_ORIENTATION=+
MRLSTSPVLLLVAGAVAHNRIPRAFAFFASPPFFDHTHSTGFAKRSRAASASSKAVHIRPNNSAGYDTQSPATTSPTIPVEGAIPITSSTFSVIRDGDNDGTAVLRERFNIQITEDDLAVLSELKGRISQQMNPFKENTSPFADSHSSSSGHIADQIVEETFDPSLIPLASHHRPESVHIILFNPQTKQEGMHTIEFPKGSGNNLVLAFESKSECDHFASQLAESGGGSFSDPVTYELALDTLNSYCQNLGVYVQVVPTGTDIRPPTSNSPVLGHNPNLNIEKLTLDYLFDMVEMAGKMDGVDGITVGGGDVGVFYDTLEGMYWVGDASDLDDEETCAIFTDDVIGCWE